MNLSFNNIKGIDNTKTAPSFKGIKFDYDSLNTPAYKFTVPPHKKDEKVILEYTELADDKKTGVFKEPGKKDFREIEFDGNKPIYIYRNNLAQEANGFAYRYRIESLNGNVRYYTDSSQRMEMADSEDKVNYIIISKNVVISPKGGSMYHYFADANVVEGVDKIKKSGEKEFIRNHFNKLGGTLKGALNLLQKSTTFDAYRYLMFNPDIGKDRISAHKYWPENQYQCTNIDDFKAMNFEAFKQGKGYVADGAFTSQGLNSPLVQHVFKWGEKSPFYTMLKIDGRFCPGVLPDQSVCDKEQALNNIGVRLVNYNPDTKKPYNKNMPTYIQFFDKRLLSKEKQENTKDLFFDYDTMPDNHYDTVKHQDSVLPLAFEIDCDDPKIKQVFKNGRIPSVILKDIPDLDDFLTFDNGTISYKRQASGSTNWDGNVDIIKMNTSNPTRGTEEGCEAARKYLFGVGSYWTELVQKELILKTAQMKESSKQKLAKNNDITAKRYKELKQTIVNHQPIQSLVLSQNKKVSDYIKTFPLQCIETAPELSAVFSEPQFNKEFLNTKINNQKVETVLNNIVNNTIDNAIPAQYKNNKEYRTYVTKIYAADIIKNVLIGALGKDIIKNDGSYDLEKLSNINIKTLEKHKSIDPKDERQQVIKAISNNINAKNAKSIEQKISKELSSISIEDFKLAESIVLQGKGGLNWRFDAAKDIGDIDAIRDDVATLNQIWKGDEDHPGVQSFWTEFIKNIRENNPASYVINEITCLSDFYKWKDPKSIEYFGGKEAVEEYKKLKDSDKDPENYNGNYKRHIDYATLARYLSISGSTTTSMFDEGFHTFTNFIGMNDEDGSDFAIESCGKVKQLMDTMESLQRYHQPDSSRLAHMFSHNHDKPAPLHCMALDTSLFLKNDMREANGFYKQIARDVTGRDDYENISSKACAVGYFLKNKINEMYPDKPEIREKLSKAIENLANGRRKENQSPDFYRADAFGTMPYHVTIEDIIEDAGLKGTIDPLDFEYEILKDERAYLLAMAKISNGCPGVYTLFNGTEFAATGWETKNKNVYVNNRHRIRRELLKDPRFKQEYNEYNSNLGLWRSSGLSALSGGYIKNLKQTELNNLMENNFHIRNQEVFNGLKGIIVNYIKNTKNQGGAAATIHPSLIFQVLDDKRRNDKNTYNQLLKEEFNFNDKQIQDFNREYNALKKYFTEVDSISLEIVPAYIYDDNGSKVIQVNSNNGTQRAKVIENKNGDAIKVKAECKKYTYKLNSISIVDPETNISPLDDGTMLKRKIYDRTKNIFIDDEKNYTVKNGAIVCENGNEKIVFDDTTATFYVPQDKDKYPFAADLYSYTK